MIGRGIIYIQIFMFIERGMNDEKCRCFLFSFVNVIVCVMLFHAFEYSDYSMLQRSTKNDFETYTPVLYVTNKIHSYDEVNGVSVEKRDGQKIIKLSDTKSDTYLYRDKSKLMELCVIKDMQPDFTTGQALMACDDFDVKQDKNKIICEINGVEFYVELRSGVAS